jgi:hypothetical protein
MVLRLAAREYGGGSERGWQVGGPVVALVFEAYRSDRIAAIIVIESLGARVAVIKGS